VLKSVRESKIVRRKLMWGLIFISPWLIGLICFTAYPIGASLVFSMTDYDIMSPPKWVGLENYADMLFDDALFSKSLSNTVIFALLSVPTSIAVGFGLALLLNQKVLGESVFRTIIFVPTLVPSVALAIMWLWLFNPQFGVVNGLLWELFGINGPGWLTDEDWSKPTLLLMSLWTVGYGVVIFLAGLQDIPQSLYEAAEIDGAGVGQKTRHVTIPLLTPVIFFQLVISIIAIFQIFTAPHVMTGGSGQPAKSLLFYVMYLYRQAFVYMRMGHASGMAWILFLIILACTLVIFRTSGWVHYSGGEKGTTTDT
jgi:multiple sugar transport system permease protein